MKIYLATRRVDHYVNKFIPELVYGLKKAGNDVAVGTDILWTESVFDYDVIYFHWPEFLFTCATSDDCEKLEKRIQELKSAGKITVAHCHNLKPHDPSKKIEAELYNIIYGHCDIMIHMGKFSLKKLQSEYPQARHFFVPHHIYTHFYTFNYGSDCCRKALKLPAKKCIVLCFGAFRNEKERAVFSLLRRKLNRDEFEIVAPSFFRGKVLQKNLAKGIANLLKIMKYRMMGVKFTTRFLSDDEMEKFFCAADVILIQRPDILNSGNLPTGFAAGKVVVGPNVGNISELLSLTNNPVFEVNNPDSLLNAIKIARTLAQDGHGRKNKKYAESYWTPEIVGNALTSIFQGE